MTFLKKLKYPKKKFIFKKKNINIKIYQKIIKNFDKIKNLISNSKNVVFNQFCGKFLSIKLFNLGLIDDPNELSKINLNIRDFLDRTISNLILKKKLVKNFKNGINLINLGKILIDSYPIHDPTSLLDRKMENKLSILK
jgi:hypothetical protein